MFLAKFANVEDVFLREVFEAREFQVNGNSTKLKPLVISAQRRVCVK